MKPLPNLPHVLYGFDRDPVERLHIRCRCEQCGESWERRCDFPERASWWVLRFAQLHGHGLRPVVKA